jgi:hypothetical protein
MKGLHLEMTLFPLYKSVRAFSVLEKHYPLFFLALMPVVARPFEHRVSVPYIAEEREKGISRSSVQGDSKVEASEVKREIMSQNSHTFLSTFKSLAIRSSIIDNENLYELYSI